MFKKVLVIVLVLLLSGTTTVLANLNNSPLAGMFENMPARLQGAPVEEASGENGDATIELVRVNVQIADEDDEDEDGPPPWFNDKEALGTELFAFRLTLFMRHRQDL